MAALMSNALPFTGVAADLIVSTNDAKYARVVGHDTYPEHPAPDTLSVIDGTRYPPQVIATVGGTVAVLSIDGKTVSLQDQIKLADRRLAGVSFTHDGKAALVALRDDQEAVVLDVTGTKVTTNRERVATGVAPYSVDVSSDGKWAVISNVGLAGLPGEVGRCFGDADSVSLVDVSTRPFRTVQYLTVPSIPEGVAISPDGCWIRARGFLFPGDPSP